ncbi:hypothetical protein VTN49DRAFT_1416 [Thermomyces lanuginosus]|uniref:uncharacterized protein n=1 Tax=Thermomyces lanuginosus TaxID=5541 RepID=UPI00374460A4
MTDHFHFHFFSFPLSTFPFSIPLPFSSLDGDCLMHVTTVMTCIFIILRRLLHSRKTYTICRNVGHNTGVDESHS